MGRLFALVYGLVSYVFFLIAFLYAIGFVWNFLVPKGIDGGTAEPFLISLLINLALLGLFAVQHSVMARPGFKEKWTKIVPKPVERSTYVLLASLILLLLYWQWRPMPEPIWNVENTAGVYFLWILSASGFLLVLLATFAINHFDLFGLRQVFIYFKRKEYTDLILKTSLFYKFIRHPIMLGFIIAFWATPQMSVGHLIFAIGTTGYIFIGIFFEERDLLKHLGENYRRYRERTPMILPRPGRK